MSRTAKTLAAVLLIYAGSYLLFRQSNIEVWDRDKRPYVIFPAGAGSALYYAWRPLSYLDGAITGMGFHIGPHS
ncbi:MAG: hypothetical protein K8F62_01300 [Pseudorhodoplanes sp.]|nr:hypothetical protein [Pseudorhodoplanes sp.]